jgi:uncharacterized protein YycO
VLGLTTIFWVGGLGVEDNLNGLRQVPSLRHVIYFCVVEPKMMPTHQSQEHKMTWNNKHVAAPFEFLRENNEFVSSKSQKCVQNDGAYIAIRH